MTVLVVWFQGWVKAGLGNTLNIAKERENHLPIVGHRKVEIKFYHAKYFD